MNTTLQNLNLGNNPANQQSSQSNASQLGTHTVAPSSSNPSGRAQTNQGIGQNNPPLASRVIQVPATNTTYKHGNIDQNGLDLSSNNHLTTIEVGEINGTLKVPSSIKEFVCKQIDRNGGVDLRLCSELTELKVSNGIIDGDLKLHINTTRLRCNRIPQGTVLNLSSFSQLTTLRVGDGKIKPTNLILPPNVKEFQCASIPQDTPLDLSSFTHLTTLWVGDGKIKPANLTLPPTITYFKCASMPQDTPLDLSSFTHLTTLWVGDGKIKPANLILPSTITYFKCASIPQGTVLDLSSFNQLTSVDVKQNIIKGTLKLFNRLITLNPLNIDNGATLDLSLCTNLQDVKLGAIQGTLILPLTTTRLECASIDQGCTLNLCNHPNLKEINIPPQAIQGTLILSNQYHGFLKKNFPHLPNIAWVDAKPLQIIINIPADATQYQHLTDIDPGHKLDLSRYDKLTDLQANNIYGKLKLPSSIQKLECQNIGSQATLKLDMCSNLHTLKVDDIDTQIILPASIAHFECGNIGSNGFIDLSACTQLKAVKVTGNISGTLKLPQSITVFECQNVEAQAILNLNTLPGLKEVTMGDISNRFLFPPTLTHFSSGDIEAGTIVDLHACFSLESFKVKNIDGLVEFPTVSNNKNLDFECGSIRSKGKLNLKTYKQLTFIKVKDIEGSLLVPSTIQTLECGNLKTDSFNLSHCNSLKSIETGKIHKNTYLLLPENCTSLTCTDVDADSLLDYRNYSELKNVTITNLKADLKFPPKIEFLECQHIQENINLDLRTHKRLKKIKIDTLSGSIEFHPNITGFELKNIAPNRHLDLSTCLSLQSLEVSDQVRQNLNLPKSFEYFTPVPAGTSLDLSRLLHLESVTLQITLEGCLTLPPNIKKLTCTSIGASAQLPNLPQCAQLHTFTVDNFHGFEKFDLPPTIKTFNYGGGKYGGTISTDQVWSSKTGLESITVGDVQANLILPPNIKRFECKNIKAKGTLNLKNCNQLTDLKISNIEEGGHIALPDPNVIKRFECDTVKNYIATELVHCIRLEDLTAINVAAPIAAPPTLKTFSITNITNQTIRIDLSQCKELDKKCLQLPIAVNKKNQFILPSPHL